VRYRDASAWLAGTLSLDHKTGQRHLPCLYAQLDGSDDAADARSEGIDQGRQDHQVLTLAGLQMRGAALADQASTRHLREGSNAHIRREEPVRLHPVWCELHQDEATVRAVEVFEVWEGDSQRC